MADQIRVLIVDDIPETRDHLSKLLGFEGDIDVVGAAASGVEALKLASTLTPDIVLMDINIPLLDGIAATRQIKTRHPHIAVIGLTCHAQGNTVNAMTNAGAFHVLPKEKALELYAIMERAVTGSAMLRGGFPEHPPSGTSLGR